MLKINNLADYEAILQIHAPYPSASFSVAIYYPDESVDFDNLKLLELDNDMLNEIREGKIIYFKGGFSEKVVLCTDSKTYDVKEAEISNSLMLVPDLKFGQSTSISPLKSPKNGQNTSPNISLNSSNEDEISYERTLERQNVLKIFHEYFECREIRPRFRKLCDLLQMTRYSGPENEYCIDKKLKFKFDQLLNTSQCSRKEFIDGLKKYRAMEIDGFTRVLEYEYEYRILNILLGLISEHSWKLDEIERTTSIQALEGIAPLEIVENLFDLYTTSSINNPEHFQYNEDMVSRIIAQNILQPGLKFKIDEFMATWQEALPEGMKTNEKYLRGLGIIDKDSPCVRSLSEENMPIILHDRLKVLFTVKTRWTIDELEPYMEYFSTPGLSVSSILAKYARSITTNGQRYYVAKHI